MKRHEPVLRRQIVRGHFTDSEDNEWRYAVEKLFRLQDLITEISVTRTNDVIMLKGNVASEQVKGLFEEILTDYEPTARLTNDLRVMTALEAADCALLIPARSYDPSIVSSEPTKIASINRHPSVSSNGKPVLGQKFRFEVDLWTTPFDRQAMKFDLPPNCQMLAVDVEALSLQLRMNEKMERRKIILFDDGRSISARFEGEVVAATAEGAVDLVVLFTFNGRWSGTTRSTFKLEESNLRSAG